MDFLNQLEQLAVSRWVRESGSVFAYPTVLFLHTLGLAMAAGVSVAVDVRVLRGGVELPLKVYRKFFPLLWAGFWINTLSGVVLVCAAATTKLTNPVFYVKLAFIAAAVVFARRIGRTLSCPSKLDACASIFCWTGAIAAGRLLAYLGTQGPGH